MVILLTVFPYGSANEASGAFASGKVYIVVYFPAAGIHPAKAAKYLVGALIKVLVYVTLKLVYELLRRISGAPGRADHVAVIATPQLVPGER